MKSKETGFTSTDEYIDTEGNTFGIFEVNEKAGL